MQANVGCSSVYYSLFIIKRLPDFERVVEYYRHSHIKVDVIGFWDETP